MSRIVRTITILSVILVACDGDIVDPVMEEGGFLEIAAGGEHTCGVAAGGSLFCWGKNSTGQLGTGDLQLSGTPARIGGGSRFIAVTAGAMHTCAINAPGALFCWGSNSRGQLGNGTTITLERPGESAPELRFAQVSAGWFHTCGIATDGRAWCWGAAGQAQAGGEGSADVLSPQLVSDSLRFAVLSAGGFHTCGLDTQGRAHCWGSNAYGQLGDGTTTNRGRPTAVVGAASYNAISAGYTHTCAVTTGRQPLCWGSSDYGELGTGGNALPGQPGSTQPVPLHGGHTAIAIAAGYYASCLVATNGLPWCWGRGDDGQLGIGTTWDSWTPQYVSAGVVGGAGLHFETVTLGLAHACGVTAAHVAYCWGRGRSGQLGADDLMYSTIAVRVSSRR